MIARDPEHDAAEFHDPKFRVPALCHQRLFLAGINNCSGIKLSF